MKLPTLDEMIGLDKFNLTESQKHDCRTLANHRGFDAAIEQAKKFSLNAPVSKSLFLFGVKCKDKKDAQNFLKMKDGGW